jgi:mRNA interferase RelE/StbE
MGKMIYKISFSNKALRIIKKLPFPLKDILNEDLKKIAVNPRLGEKLSGEINTYRYRMGKYRVIYEIHDKELIVLVVNFGHRKEIYRDL